ncbi:MAG TPA: isochorismate synthase [Segeticoccus sp.]|uniref:isochorismate synthase n=1 Tax=Segeticoccus sp. TaxID=2706531 RepID=UPI002D805A02|nr:isochorismate synthase [Segeticoccus sp.]HET8601153.1 isochorismate synthase [Segeticoccus sp.]
MTSEPTAPLASLPVPTAPLVTRTVEIEDPGPLLALLPDSGDARALSSWVRGGDGLVGWGRTRAVATGGATRFADAEAWWREQVHHAVVRDEVRLPGTGPVAFGSFAFADDSPSGGALVIPEVVVGRREGRCWVTTTGSGTGLPPRAAVARRAAAVAPGDVEFAAGALDGSRWTAAVARAVGRIAGGEVDKVVLARDVVVNAAGRIDPRWVLEALAGRYTNTWVFAVDGLVGATPEMLVRLEKGLVTSRVLAGTIRRSGDDERDLALAGSLARSSKDLEEHEYAVRSVADALRPHCTSLNAPESPFVLHLHNVMHLATDVAGVLADGTTSLALAGALHPSAAVCGTPRETAAGMIAALEGMDRGRYAGPVGWMDASGDGEWGIALRCGAYEPDAAGVAGDRMRLFAGCGIVAGSDPQAELAESEAKLVPMRDALTGP